MAGDDDAADDEGEAELWLLHQQYRASIRILFTGVVVLLPSILWLNISSDSAYTHGSLLFTRIRVIGMCAVGIGVYLVIAGLVMFARARSQRMRLPVARLTKS